MRVVVLGIDRRSGGPLALYRPRCGRDGGERDPGTSRRYSRDRAFAD